MSVTIWLLHSKRKVKFEIEVNCMYNLSEIYHSDCRFSMALDRCEFLIDFCDYFVSLRKYNNHLKGEIKL